MTRPPRGPGQGAHCPIVHLSPEGTQPKLRRVLHQRAKPWDKCWGAAVNEAARQLEGQSTAELPAPTQKEPKRTACWRRASSG
ncbi:hypothetical protein HPG69_003022 [Diceros bicornis minor]|uniref:Uncharacterized protein n=1 Tax=Diceros bicornis minor TaxID=77932 RepID=A0A7J7EJJ6_DICBM|nr:hypothetical protein HPG69_003022 [Diceros bicornis minor]